MDILDALERTRTETLPLFGLPEAELEKTYAPGKWSARRLLHHLADAETILYDRVRRVISEPRGVIWAFDQDAWCAKLDYDARPLSLSRDIYASVRNGVIHEARAHYAAGGHLEFIHSETGLRTLKDEFDKIAAHNAHHLGQILTALARPGKETK